MVYCLKPRQLEPDDKGMSPVEAQIISGSNPSRDFSPTDPHLLQLESDGLLLCAMVTTRTPQLLDEGGEDRRSLNDYSSKFLR